MLRLLKLYILMSRDIFFFRQIVWAWYIKRHGAVLTCIDSPRTQHSIVSKAAKPLPLILLLLLLLLLLKLFLLKLF